MADQTLRITRGEAELNNIKTVFGNLEFNKFFEKKGYNDYQLKSGMEEVFLNFLTAKYLQPYLELDKTQASTESIRISSSRVAKELELLNWGLPWAQPFINFLRLFAK